MDKIKYVQWIDNISRTWMCIVFVFNLEVDNGYNRIFRQRM